MKTDITDSIGADLCEEARRLGARVYRLERGTLMVRHPENLTTQFFFDEEDALGVLRDGKPPKRRDLEMRERRPHHTDDAAQKEIFE